MGGHADQTLLVYADYACPFCYLGYASLDQCRENRDEPVETDWHPFDLRAHERGPDGTLDDAIDSGKDDAYFEQAKQNVERLAAEYGVEMRDDPLHDVDTYSAQRVALRAREDHPEAFEAFHRAVLDALWQDRRDVSDADVLDAIATEAGLPEGFVAETLADETSREDLEAAFADARDERVTGVPTFVLGEHRARGAVPPADLDRLLGEAGL